jgi:steroid delta-isomerase-like uncharacterized protein
MQTIPGCVVLLFGVLGFLAPGSAASARENKALVEAFTAAVNNHDLIRLNDLVADDFVRHCQATPEVRVRSLGDFKSFLKANRVAFPDERVTLTQLTAAGDRVAFWGKYVGTQSGPMGPFPPSDKKMDVDISGVFRIRDGRIAELWIIWDNLAGLVQLGLVSPPGASTQGER